MGAQARLHADNAAWKTRKLLHEILPLDLAAQHDRAVRLKAHEVENVLAAIPGVVEVAVIGVPDETFGEALLAIFAMKPGHSIDTEAMVAFCRDKLAGYKIPRRLECVDALPRNPSGKILKTVLREPHWQGIDRRIS